MTISWQGREAPPGTSLHVADTEIVRALRGLGFSVEHFHEGGAAASVLVCHSQPRAFERPPGFGRVFFYLTTTSWNTIPKMYVEYLRRCDHVFVLNSLTLECCRGLGMACSLWPRGVDPALCRVEVPRRDAFTFVNVSQGAAFKNNALLARAFQEAFGGDRDVRMVKVDGTDSFCSGLTGGVPGNVELVPATADRSALFRLLRSSHVYVSASYQESFGIATLEAMACGLPVLHTDMPAMHDSPFEGRVELIPTRPVVRRDVLLAYHRPHWRLTDFVDTPVVHEAQLDDVVSLLRKMREDYAVLEERAKAHRQEVLANCAWEAIAERCFVPVVDRMTGSANS